MDEVLALPTDAPPAFASKQIDAWAAEAEYDTRVARQIQTGKVLYYQPVEGGPYAKRVWRQVDRTASIGGPDRRGPALHAALPPRCGYGHAAADADRQRHAIES